MEYFNLMKCALIENTDKISVEHSLEKPMKNTLKTLVNFETVVKTGSNIYSNTFSVDIPRSYDNLSQLYIKLTLSTGLAAITPASMLATKIFKKITLRTKRGTTIQKLTPEYIQARIGELEGTPLYTKIESSIDSSSLFSAGSVVVYVPLFFFFSENENVFLNTRKYEQLELEMQFNDTSELMGMETVDLTSVTCDFYGLFHDTNGSSYTNDMIFTNKNPEQVKGSYDIFFEDNQTVSDSSTSTKFILRNPHPTFAMHIIITNQDGDTKNINRIKMSIGSRIILDLDLLMNYTFYGSKKGFIDSNAFTYYFSKMKERSVDSGLIIFSKEMSPTTLELFYDSDAIPTGANYVIKTVMEHRTNFTINEKGEFSLSDDVKDIVEGQLSTNTVQERSFLT